VSSDYVLGDRMNQRPRDAEPLPAPAACPFCGSAKISTTSTTVDTTSYWRCATCGDVWNVERLRPSRYHQR